jgi:hypothetical protein
MKAVIFWVAVGIVAWLGLRHLLSMLTGRSQDGPLKPGQHLCYATSFLLLMGSSVVAAILRVWWLLPVGVVSEHLFRRYVIWTGEKFPLTEEEKQMSMKEYLKHITNNGRTNERESIGQRHERQATSNQRRP